MSFDAFSFHPQVAAGIAACGYTTPTPIQVQAMPLVLAGHDLVGLAQTGTGKTAAFVLPILERLLPGPRGQVRALVIAPTRELAEQIRVACDGMGPKTGLTSMAVYGGVSKVGQTKRLRAGVDIVVACPGRLLDLLGDRAIDLSRVEMLVLDEADQMFDMGFLPAIRRILRHLPARRQTLLFSATMPEEIRVLTAEVLRAPKTVQADTPGPAPTISHRLFPVPAEGKLALLKTLVTDPGLTSTLVFTRTKHRAKSLARQLEAAGVAATAIQGNLSQNRRQEALEGFRSGRFRVLVATDIAARGIDVAGVSHVINFDVPDSAEAYTHRTGRTGRACRTGEAYTFASPEDAAMIRVIERTLGERLCRQQVTLSPEALAAPCPLPSAESRRPSRPSSRPARPARPSTPAGERRQPGPGQSHRRPAPLGLGAVAGRRTGGNRRGV
ncbi:MAG: DEAD/DEAH box helicase [Thermodesulfobacteriota bacterium]